MILKPFWGSKILSIFPHFLYGCTFPNILYFFQLLDPPKEKKSVAVSSPPRPVQSAILPQSKSPSSDVIVLSESRFTDKQFLSIPIFDPANALLFLSQKNSLKIKDQDWLVSSNLKLSGNNEKGSDPAFTLIHISYNTSDIPSPKWFVSCLLNLPKKAVVSVHPTFRLPSKVQAATLAADFSTFIPGLLNYLSIVDTNVKKPSKSPCDPTPAKYSPDYSVSTTMISCKAAVLYPMAVSDNGLQGPRHYRVDMFIPMKYIHYGPYRQIDGSHTGQFSAYCPVAKSFGNYVCYYYGQYPWGHSKVDGTMAYICSKLGITLMPNVRNTCLPLHVTIGLLEQKIISIDDVVIKFREFFITFFSSSFRRDGVPTIMSFVRKMKLADKVCIRIVNSIEVGHFTLMDRYFGKLTEKKIYIVHSYLHFFLVKHLNF